MDERVCVGVIVAAHGVRGQVKIKCFTADPAAVAAYGPVSDEAGARWQVRAHGAPKDGTMVASLSGVADRDAAEALRGRRLYVPRASLPAAAEDEFYHADLVGLEAVTAAGARLGRVLAVQNFGGGDLLEIDTGRGTELVPFTKAAVPQVDLAARRLVVDAEAALPRD